MLSLDTMNYPIYHGNAIIAVKKLLPFTSINNLKLCLLPSDKKYSNNGLIESCISLKPLQFITIHYIYLLN